MTEIKTEKQKIREWLKRYKTLTVYEAIHKAHVYNLRSRASEMSEIASRRITIVRADGRRVSVAEYYLVGEV